MSAIPPSSSSTAAALSGSSTKKPKKQSVSGGFVSARIASLENKRLSDSSSLAPSRVRMAPPVAENEALIRDLIAQNAKLSKAFNLLKAKRNPELGVSPCMRNEIPSANYSAAMSQKDLADTKAFLQRLPPMPKKMLDFLESCGSDGIKAKETHIAVPLVKNLAIDLDGKIVEMPRILENLDALDKASGGKGCRFGFMQEGKFDLQEPPAVEFEWAVMTRDVLPGTKGQSYVFQANLLAQKGYEVPSFIDVVSTIIWAKYHFGISLFLGSPIVHTRCRQKQDGSLVVVGGTPGESLSVLVNNNNSSNLGMAGFRRNFL